MIEGGTVHIVKRHNHGRQASERFEREKLHKSIVAACLSAGVPEGHADSIARRISDQVEEWLENRPEVTSDDLRRSATHFLRTHHPDAAYLYEHHRSTL